MGIGAKSSATTTTHRPMITTTTIEKTCIQEEAHAGRRSERIGELTFWLEQGLSGNLEEQFLGTEEGIRRHECFQLACEAIKWHHIRRAGSPLHPALQRMVGF
jgi:hypothetical protein